MGGNLMDGGGEFDVPLNVARNLVLVGRTGNGKSATGNSIIGRKVFKSRASTLGVTSACESQTAVFEDGQIIKVIDTPGLFDLSTGSEFVGKEIVRCMTLAEGGIHAVLLVFSVRSRLSQEEESALRNLQTLFGSKIIDYMIVVFTGGDELEENEETLEEYLARGCPEFLKEILVLCGNRVVLFDNKTNDKTKKAEQVQKLLSLVDAVVEQNDGKPYTDELFNELKEGAMKLQDQQREVESLKGYSKEQLSELKKQIETSYEQQLSRIAEMLETKLKETAMRLEQQLAEEQAARRKAEKETAMRLEQQLAEERAARLKAEKMAKEVEKKSNDEIQKLRENLEKAQTETKALRRKVNDGPCNIL